MNVSFAIQLLAALNEDTEVKEDDWNSVGAARGKLEMFEVRCPASLPDGLENRFVATVSCGMAKARAR